MRIRNQTLFDFAPLCIQNSAVVLNVTSGQTRRHPHLFGVGEIELGGQIDDLQFDNVFFVGERLGHLSQHVWGDLGDVLAVFSNQPQDAGSSHRHLATGRKLNPRVVFAHGCRLLKSSNQGTRLQQVLTTTHLDVVCQFGHVLDDVAVLLWLHLQQLLDHHHRLGNDQFCAAA